MGYTHYWGIKPVKGGTELNEKRYKRAIKQCNRVIKAYHNQHRGYGESLSGYSAHSDRYGGLNFNGARGNICEDFIFREHFKENEPFEFCKTRRLPYDLVVTACLSIMKHYLKDAIEVSSDGDWCDWTDGACYASEILNVKIKVPSNVEKRAQLSEVI